MEQRVTRLEDNFDKLAERLGRLEVQLATLNERVAHLPTKDQLTRTALAIVGAMTALIVFGEKLQTLVH